MRRAYEVFGLKLKPLLRQVGFAKTTLLAKLANAKAIVRAGKIKLKDGPVVALDAITKKELEDVVRVAKLRRGHRTERTIGPSHDFTVPTDVIRITTMMESAMKALLPRKPSVVPRFRVMGEPPSINHLQRLAAVLKVIQMFVRELLKPKLLATPGRRLIVSTASSGKDGALQLRRPALVKLLTRLAETTLTVNTTKNVTKTGSTATARGSRPRRPRRE